MAPRFIFFLISLAIVVQGRSRHYKHKKAYAINREQEQLQQRDYQQPAKDQAGGGPPQNANVYKIALHKFDKNNKLNAHMNAHSVAVSMQGPGAIELDTSQTQVAPGEQRPDHTVSVAKDTEHTPAVTVMSVKNTGSELPVNLPLSELPEPQQTAKQGKPHDVQEQHLPVRPSQSVRLRPKAASKHVRPDNLEAMSTLKELGTLSTKPHRQAASHHRQPIHTPGANTHQQLPDEPKKPQQPLLRLHQNVNKVDAGKILTRIESNVPVNVQKPQYEERVDKGHKIKLSNDGKPQRVFGKVDANNVALTMQGPGTAAVTSHLKAGTQTVVFDPMPPEPCPDQNCPQSQGSGKRHMHKN